MLEDARRSEHAKQRAQRAPTQRAQPARDRPTRTQRAPRRLAPLQLACGASTAGIAATTAAGRRERGAAHAQRHQGRRETAPTCEHPLAPTRAAPRARCTCHPALLLDVRTCRQCNSAKFCLSVFLSRIFVFYGCSCPQEQPAPNPSPPCGFGGQRPMPPAASCRDSCSIFLDTAARP